MALSETTPFAYSTIGVSPYLRQYMERKMLKEMYPNLVHLKDSNDFTLPRGNGRVIEWRRRSRIAVSAASTYQLTEGVTPDPLTRATEEVKATTYNFGGFFPTTDVAEIQSLDPTDVLDLENLSKFISEVDDIYVRDIIVAGTNVIYAAGRANRAAITSADVLTDAEIKKARVTLENASVPKFPDGTYHCIVPTRTMYDLMSTDGWKFTGYYQRADDIAKGRVGQLYGITFMESPITKYYDNAGSGSIDVEASLFYGPDAFGTPKITELSLAFINKPLGSAGAADPLNQRGSRGTKNNLGAAILDQRRIVRVEHAATVTR